MDSTPSFRSSLPVLPEPPAATQVWLIDVSGESKVLIKAANDAAVVAQIAVPFGRSRRYNPDVLAAGTRPGEWMLIGRSTAVAQVMSELSPAGRVTVVDYTHGRAMVRIVGPSSISTLAKLCSADFSDQMFPNGGVLGANVAGVICDLVRADIGPNDRRSSPDDGGSGGVKNETLISFLIMFDRSYGNYMAGALFDAMAEFLV